MVEKTFHVTWQMYNCLTEKEFTRGNEMAAKTVAQVQKWIRDELPKRDHGNWAVDAVSISEQGNFHDTEGEPCNSKLVGTFEPQVGEWVWA